MISNSHQDREDGHAQHAHVAPEQDAWLDRDGRKWHGYWRRKLDGTWGYSAHFSGWDTDMGDMDFAEFEKAFGPVIQYRKVQLWRRDDGWEQREVDPSPARVAYLRAAGYGLANE